MGSTARNETPGPYWKILKNSDLKKSLPFFFLYQIKEATPASFFI